MPDLGSIPIEASELTPDLLEGLIGTLHPGSGVRELDIRQAWQWGEGDAVSTSGRIDVHPTDDTHEGALPSHLVLEIARPALPASPLYRNEVDAYRNHRPRTFMHLIEIDPQNPNHAGGEVFALGYHHLLAPDGSRTDSLVGVRYLDRFGRQAGKRRFVRRDVVCDLDRSHLTDRHTAVSVAPTVDDSYDLPGAPVRCFTEGGVTPACADRCPCDPGHLPMSTS